MITEFFFVHATGVDIPDAMQRLKAGIVARFGEGSDVYRISGGVQFSQTMVPKSFIQPGQQTHEIVTVAIAVIVPVALARYSGMEK